MDSNRTRILIVDDEPAHAEAMRRFLTAKGSDAEVKIVGTLREYRQTVAEQSPDIALLDLNLPDGRAVEVLTAPAEEGDFPALILTSYGNQEIAVEAMKAGAIDYVVKSPEAFADIPRTVERALREWNLLLKRRQAEKKLQRSEAGFRSLFENMQEGLAYCRMLYKDGEPRDWVYLQVNDAFERMTGLKDVVGKRVSRILPGLRAANPEIFEIYGRVARTGRPERFEAYVEPLDDWYSASVYSPGKDFFVALFDVITERKRAEEGREATVEMLRLCTRAASPRELMRDLTRFFQRFSGCEAVGVRLPEGNDFPYYETRGFSEEFLLAENSLCAADPAGELARDDVGHPALDCMCGNVLGGRFDPAKPFFTPRGSFWSSHTSEMLASTTEADRQAKTRNRCHGEGYESVALIPLRLDDETLGLFQFNDRRTGRFTAEKIALLETMVDYVAITLAKLRADEALKESSQLNAQIIHSAGEGVIVYDQELRYRVWNPCMEQLTGLPAGKVLGRRPQEVFPSLLDSGLFERLELARSGQIPDPLEFPAPATAAGPSGWWLDTSAPLRNTKGEVIGVIGTVQDITERKRYEQELAYQASHDALTGLANRNLLTDRVGQSLIYADRSQRIVAVLLLDLDRFKVINDSLGHSHGDELLRMVAARLGHCVRAGDTVSRLGGDEFVVTLTEVAEVDDVGLLAKRIREALVMPFRLGGHELRVTASIGVSLYPKDGDGVENLLRHADIAMYRAKEDGGDTFRFFAPDMNLRIQGTLELEADLRLALQRQEFILHYQPKVEIASGRIDGCEALVRWRHPVRGMVSPGDFIPLAEETGLIVPLGAWVLREACAQIRAWQEMGLPAVKVAVNLSARQFRQPDLAGQVRAALAEAGLLPSMLELELTESMIMHDPTGAAETMRDLKELGVSLSLDDFGTGYSSLNYLRRFPVDHLKIDRSFITDVTSDASAAAMANSVVAIAHSLGIKAVAEGVETWEQLDLLTASRCDAFQGYLFSKPLPADDFAPLLREGRPLARPRPPCGT